MAKPDGQHKIVLPDGSVHRVDAKVFWAAWRLQKAIRDLVTGVTQSFVLVEGDAQGRTRPTIVIGDQLNLDAMDKELVEQSKQFRQLATQWEGNAPAAARSTSEH